MTLFTKPARPHHLIDPVAFFLALVAAPLIVTMLTFWIFLVPVYALVMGGPIYLLFATPVLLWWLTRNPPEIGEIAALGFCANLLASAGAYLFALSNNAYDPGSAAMLYLGFGSIFAPVWAATFAWIYRSIRRTFYNQTV